MCVSAEDSHAAAHQRRDDEHVLCDVTRCVCVSAEDSHAAAHQRRDDEHVLGVAVLRRRRPVLHHLFLVARHHARIPGAYTCTCTRTFHQYVAKFACIYMTVHVDMFVANITFISSLLNVFNAFRASTVSNCSYVSVHVGLSYICIKELIVSSVCALCVCRPGASADVRWRRRLGLPHLPLLRAHEHALRLLSLVRLR